MRLWQEWIVMAGAAFFMTAMTTTAQVTVTPDGTVLVPGAITTNVTATTVSPGAVLVLPPGTDVDAVLSAVEAIRTRPAIVPLSPLPLEPIVPTPTRPAVLVNPARLDPRLVSPAPFRNVINPPPARNTAGLLRDSR